MKILVSLIDDAPIIQDSIISLINIYENDFELGGIYSSVKMFLNDPRSGGKDQVHLLLLDIGLPDISGIEGIPLILEKVPDLDIIMLTNYEKEDAIIEALCSGASAYVLKKEGINNILDTMKVVAAGGSFMSPLMARKVVNYLGRRAKAPLLSDRQKEILEKLTEGKSYQSIAEELNLSIETVRSHIKKMYRVLQVSNKVEAVTRFLGGSIF